MKLAAHFYVVSRSIVQLYLHSFIHLNGVVLSDLSIGRTLPLLLGLIKIF
jgi:hypothetical protein